MREPLESGFLDFIRRTGIISPGDHILAAYSGGTDSTCLLSLLAKTSGALGIAVSAFYLDHGLRCAAELAAEKELVESNCRAFGIRLLTASADVRSLASKSGISLEEAGREARYGLLAKAAAEIGCNKIATAHHLDDAAETLLLKLIKGASPSALAGIRESAGNVIRPLLFATRADIERYVSAAGLKASTDTTNLDERYERNFVRARIMPLAKELNPNFCARISSFMNIQREESDFVDSAVRDFFDKRCREFSGRVEAPADEFGALHAAVRRRFLLFAARRCGVAPDLLSFGAVRGALGHIEKRFPREIFEAVGRRFYISLAASFDPASKYSVSSRTIIFSGARPVPRFEGGGLESVSLGPGESAAVRGGGFEYVFSVLPLAAATLRPSTGREGEAALCGAARYEFAAGESVSFPLTLRSFAPGDRIRPRGMKGLSQKISDIFVNEKIYGPIRRFVPVICSADGEVLAVCNVKLSESVSPVKGDPPSGASSGYLVSVLSKEIL